ncbi:MAG: gamma-glutamyltransferase [Opitutales bacterium]|nr:gamma-glutamyltransferase [Opitutales bacterium]
MVATQERHATEAALAVLEEGGNAVDAAVTAAFTLSVTLPRAGALGGGGFMVVHQAEKGRTFAIDYRETAPAAAHRDLFLREDGTADPSKSRFSALVVGVPGNVAGLLHALENYGTVDRERALAPAITLAEEGFPVTKDLFDSLVIAAPRLFRDPAAREVFYSRFGAPRAIGETLHQPDLAGTLRRIAEEGVAGYYSGPVAEKTIDFLRERGGIMTTEDLANYRPVERSTVSGSYRGHTIRSMPPPSSGGVHLLQILKMIEPEDIGAMEFGSARSIHLMAEAMKRAYADRSVHLGDTDFVDVALAELLDRAYLGRRMADFSPRAVTPAEEIAPGDPFESSEGDNTTHFSIVDAHGNAVSNTYSINFSYGAQMMAPGTGVLLNNTMDDFSAKPGAPNAYGLIGGEKNAVEGGKRMLSSMTPTIVLDGDGDVFLVTGSPGGSRIITTTLHIVVNTVDHGMNIAEATNAPRFHHQWLPDYLRIENGFSPDTLEILRGYGHEIREMDAMGSTQSILRSGSWWTGSSDPRRPDAATLGH